METTPRLEYTENYPEGRTLHANLGSSLYFTVRFSSQSYGQCDITIYKDGTKFKTIRANKGVVTIDLGVQNTEGSSIYTVTGVDAQTIPALETLTYRVVVGGAKISTDMQDIIDGGINTSSPIRILYNASVADTQQTVKVYGELVSSSGDIIKTHTNQGGNVNGYTLSNQA
jgi:hypothetical protein